MIRGVIAGGLVLAGMEAVLSTSAAAGRAGGILTDIGGLVDRFLDPSVAAIPDRSIAAAAPAGPAPASSGGPPGPPRHAHSAATSATGPVGPGI